ncbi:MAG TPA: amino acid ABC transporter permease [Pseudonocardiaceae bacterium]|jgi:polar amino acid transport system permease protein|nr:amino acid ABC transporter permease [Pseudonocardiaceae bacterium]
MTTTEAARPDQPAAPEAIVAVPVRHPGRWVAAVILVVLAAMFVHGLVTNPAWKWDTVGQYLFSGQVLDGLLVTIELTLLAMVIGVVLGIVVAVMRLSTNPIVSGIAWLYAWFFRGTPVLVQIVFWSFIGLLYRYPGLGIPFGPTFVYFDANQLIPVFVGATLGLGLNEAAYMSEIVRAGILSVDSGQTEAAEALGMTRMKVLRRIVLPQAMRIIIPPTGNEVISMLKTTSLVTIVAIHDLFGVVQFIYGNNFQQIPLLVVASIWYLVLTSVLSVGQYYIERRYSRGAVQVREQGWLSRMMAQRRAEMR